MRAEFYLDRDRVEKSVKKGITTKIQNHGKDIFSQIAIKSSNTKSNTIINGETMHVFSAKKSLKTRIEKYGMAIPNMEAIIKTRIEGTFYKKIKVLKSV